MTLIQSCVTSTLNLVLITSYRLTRNVVLIPRVYQRITSEVTAWSTMISREDTYLSALEAWTRRPIFPADPATKFAVTRLAWVAYYALHAEDEPSPRRLQMYTQRRGMSNARLKRRRFLGVSASYVEDV